MDESSQQISSKTITLAGKDYKVTVPLTLGQLIECQVGMASLPGASEAEDTRESYMRNCRVIVAALKPDNPDLTIEALTAMRFNSLIEFNAAARKVYVLCGLLSDKDDEPETQKDGAKGEGAAET